MEEHKKILKDRLDKLSPKLKNFILGGELEVLLSDIVRKFNLSEDQSTALENEIVFVLIGLEPKEDFIENIKIELGLDINICLQISSEVNKNILLNLNSEINLLLQQKVPETASAKTQDKNGVGDSFAQAIVNQAKAMRPIQQGQDTSYEVRETRENKIPDNLPTGDKPKDHTSYKPNKDPYREPLE